MDWPFFIMGVFSGIISGFIPGLHSNTVIAVASTFGLGNGAMSAFIIALLSAHMVSAFIPSIFFGIPNDSSVVSVLPGQRMVREGKGIVALKTVLCSVLIAVLVSVALFHPSLSIYPIVYGMLRPYMGWVLLAFALAFIWTTKNKFLSACIFLLAGIMGTFTLRMEMYDVFMPLFSGFFAMSGILTYEKGARIGKQKDGHLEHGFIKYALIGVFLGFFADLLPGVGAPSQIAALSSIAISPNTAGYLALVSSISSSEAVFALSTTASIGKSRMGAVEWLTQYADVGSSLAGMLTLMLIAVGITVVALYLARKMIGKLASLDFSKFNVLLAIYLAVVIYLMDGIAGLGIFAVASGLGYLTVKLGVSRTTLMGSIIIPTILLLFRIII